MKGDQRPAPGTTDEGVHGFALLKISGATLNVSYIDEFGTEFFAEQL